MVHCLRILFTLIFLTSIVHAQMAPATYPEIKHPKEDKPPPKEWEWSLPIFGQRVLDKGISLPRPYGLSLVFSHLSQEININDLEVSFDNSAPLRPVDFINFGKTEVENTTWQLKADAWILPFLNLFGLLGTIQGKGNVPIGIAYRDIFEFFNLGICNVAIPPAICSKYINATAPIDYHGVSVGLGILLAGGYKDFFFAMPISYVSTDVNVSDTNIHATNITPRFGYNYKSAFHGKFGFYLGANYLDSSGTLSGSYTLPMEGTAVGHDVDVRYEMTESPVDHWNGIIGLNWELSEFWSITLEIGHSQHRDQQTFVFAYRF